MKLPKDLLSDTYRKPNVYLCETDKTRICGLETIDMSASLRFNAYSELTFTIPRTYINMTTGETKVNPHYDKIQALRLIELEGFGYFEIQDPEIISDGLREVKNITAYGLEYTLAQKYLEDLKINTGEIDSLEVLEAGENGVIIPITLYDEGSPNLSLLNIILEKAYGWSIGHIDTSLKTMGRTFEISRVSIYDFIVQEICDKFNCFAVFDTEKKTINLFAEELMTKHIGDGINTLFACPYAMIGSVTIDGYRTTEYSSINGYVEFENPPANGAKIIITDGSQQQWETDVYISFDNLVQEVNVSYSADNIKTVLTVKGADNLDIREVNMGLPYLVDLSYYYTPEWMGQDLYDSYTQYLQDCDDDQEEYQKNAQDMIIINGKKSYEENRLSLQYSEASVTSTTVGTYYVRGGSKEPYYYTEVKLPDEWVSGVQYYMLSGTDLNTDKFNKFYEALKIYFSSENNKDTTELTNLQDSFSFMQKNTIKTLVASLKNATSTDSKKNAILLFLDELWDQLGLTPLKTRYREPYKQVKITNEEDGWNNTSSDNYWNYYPVIIVLESLDKAIKEREETIEAYQTEYNNKNKRNNEITNNALIYNKKYFSDDQLVRLSAFLREDEYTDDNFVETDADSIETIMKTKRELLECGKIELSKLCEPKLEFSMDMANIYALPEFEPIINQFQLGKLINVVIRDDYIKRARLLEVNINFDDFSDFTCEFGELTSLKTQSSIHADLLASALTAGKSVASNASYWNQSSDSVTSLALLIHQGLLDAATVIKATDGNQGVEIDRTGIHLRKYDPITGELDSKEGWIVNNQFLYSDDNFQTAKSVFGEYTIDGQTKWGLLAEAVMAGCVAGCDIVGGTIRIGEQSDGNWAFEVDEKGNVSMLGGAVKFTADKNSLNDVSNRLDTRINETNSTIERTNESIESEVTRAEKAESVLRSNIKINADSITAEVTRAEKVEESLRSSIQINANSISSKVNSGDFGTLIEQNYDHVKIAWNNNSKYIAFEDGSLNIYKSTSHSSDTLLMKHNDQGAWYYYNGHTVGQIGTNKWKTDTSYRGLVFDLENDAHYMCWAHRDDANDTDYTVKLIYHANNSKAKQGLHLECDTYTNGNLYLSDNHRIILYSDDSIGYAGEVNIVNDSNSAAFRMNGAEKLFECFGNSAIKIYNNVSIDCYSSINMHGFYLIDTELTTSSDVRLKTNIQDTTVDALSMINQIEMKEFDWIEDRTHENIGMIAQQLQIIAPDLVIEDSVTGQLSIKTSKFIPYLIKAIQQLSKDDTRESIATYSLKSKKWVDPYDMEAKDNFVQNLKDYEYMPLNVEKTEAIHQKVIIPIDRNVND